VHGEITVEEYLTVIQYWLSDCDLNHDCITEDKILMPTRLLELGTLGDNNVISLVEPRHEGIAGKYMTLSHCWGESKTIETRKNNIHQRKRGIEWAELPKTFQHAIAITRGLGIKYLWIDSLCIIQNDSADWERESRNMSTVYANSYLNIAATRSLDSNGGLFSPRWMEAMEVPDVFSCPLNEVKIECTSPGQAFEVYARFPHVRAHEDFFQDFTSGRHVRSPLLTRAWVFQELYLCPRTVHFHSSELIWECRNSLRCECNGIKMTSTRVTLRRGGVA
jgi:hypothetical protein